ncbi:IclR family transcriptional regulator [Saccharothrix coeruleofusca]|uniref:IclR family transcriptional regulator n=1 Tax=Saccharothrix coeruleofusca TaxID=33919 RepID=A0A918EDQ0_9PSEU|nr:IclR family transcriptional regulator [Saccharothrix coeruleofusca]MBP2338766.1 DNA-binding IclR family transcriptional regulator [Saccharothrix coeruleofusca]GGP46109.1 IclR family transcriptional regulator [Saccharothrix coeruleofusca]
MPVPKSLLGRAFTLLGVFSEQRPSATLSELSRLSGLPLSTTHRLVRELLQWRALDRDARGRYSIGLRLWELGALSPGSLDLRERALPFLEDLVEVTRHNAQLAIRDGLDAVFVERLSARDAVSVVSRAGSRLPLHATGVGLVLLAHAPAQVQELALASPLRRFTSRTICAPARLREALAQVRRDGYAISDRQIEMITYSVAAPVRDAGGEVVAAVSVVLPTGARTDAAVSAVRTCGRAISRALGAP